MQLQKRIRDLREDNDLRQREMAAYLQVSVSAYGSYENGVHMPPIEYLPKLARYYGVSTDYLLGLTDDPAPPKKKGR